MLAFSSDDREGADRFDWVVALTRTLTSDVDLPAVLDRILAIGCEVTGAHYAALGIFDVSSGEVERLATVGLDEEARESTRAVPSGRGDLAFPPANTPMGSVIGVPVTIRNQRTGSLFFGEKQGAGDFSEHDSGALAVLAEIAAAAIDADRLKAEGVELGHDAQRASQALRSAMEIATAIGSDTDLPRILSLIVKRGQTLVGADALLIWLRHGDQLRIAAVAGNADVPEESTIPLEASTAGAALNARRSVRIEDVRWMRVDPADFGVSQAHNALIVPLVHRGRGHGVLMAFDHLGESRGFDDDNQRALEAFAASVATAVATARSVEAQRLRDTMAAAESERRVWARELHDETLQGLAALKLALAGALRAGPSEARAMLEAAVAQLDNDIAGLRAIIADLRPAALDELGLEPALRTLIMRVTEAAGLEARVVIVLGNARLEPDVETIAYRVAQEALTNVVKHADAGMVAIDVRLESGELRLTITDDGSGFGEELGEGYGLVGMRERAALASGSLEISPVPDGGTSVTLEVPLD